MLRTSENYKFVIDIQHLVILIWLYRFPSGELKLKNLNMESGEI
jgi:hypothetical protein